MKSYENNMADQDVIVHSLRVLSEIKNPALSQLRRDVNSTRQVTAQIAQKNDKYWKELSDDGIITPLEKKIILREMENIANSYTALYTEAVAEHYDTAEFFLDYQATYNDLRTYIYSTLALFDNMDENTEVDRDEFNSYFSDYYYSENFTIVSMTVGVITNLGFKILTSLEDEGEEDDVGIYHGVLYQYIDGEWKIINRELYYGKSAVLPPVLEGRYFLNSDNSILADVLYVNDDPLELNGEIIEIGTDYEKGIIYVYEDNHWQRKEPDEDYRYLVAMGDYYSVNDQLPDIMKSEVESIARTAAGADYYGPSIVPPVNPKENDYFLYSGETTSENPPRWIFASLYMYKNGEWTRLDEDVKKNQKYFMEALQDILTITAADSGYFSTVFCNAFFGNEAALNALSTKVIYLQTGGALRSDNYSVGEEGLLIDADGNIDAMGDTHIGGHCVIDGDAIYRGSIESGALQLYNMPAAIVEVIATTSTNVHDFIVSLQNELYYFPGTSYYPESLTINNISYNYFYYSIDYRYDTSSTATHYVDVEKVYYWQDNEYLYTYHYYRITTKVTYYRLSIHADNTVYDFLYTETEYIWSSKYEYYYWSGVSDDYRYTVESESSLPRGTHYTGDCPYGVDIEAAMGSRTLKLVGLPLYSDALPANTVYTDENGFLKVKS